MNEKDSKLLRKILGETSQLIEIEVNGEKWQGIGIIDYPNGSLSYSKAMYVESLWPSRMSLIEQNWRLCHNRNIRLWSDSGIDVHAIPKMPVMDIVSYAGVGNGTGFDNDRSEIFKTMNLIYSEFPFEITSAGENYLVANFIEPIKLEQAIALQDILMNLTTEVLNDAYFLIHGTDSPGFNDETVIAKAIVKDQSFWLNLG